MEYEIELLNGQEWTNSLNVADVFKKEHRDILKAFKNLECSQEFRQRNFAQSTYANKQNKQMPVIKMNKNGFAFLIMGFTGKKAAQFKEGYINAFDKMHQIQNDQVQSALKQIGYNSLKDLIRSLDLPPY